MKLIRQHYIRRILLVNNEMESRALLSKMFSRMGYDVIMAPDGIQGLYLLVTTPVDLVVTNFDMPHMNGWSLAHHVKFRSPATPVVLIADDTADDPLGLAHEPVFDAMISSPFDRHLITKTLHALLPDWISSPAPESPGLASDAGRAGTADRPA